MEDIDNIVGESLAELIREYGLAAVLYSLAEIAGAKAEGGE